MMKEKHLHAQQHHLTLYSYDDRIQSNTAKVLDNIAMCAFEIYVETSY